MQQKSLVDMDEDIDSDDSDEVSAIQAKESVRSPPLCSMLAGSVQPAVFPSSKPSPSWKLCQMQLLIADH